MYPGMYPMYPSSINQLTGIDNYLVQLVINYLEVINLKDMKKLIQICNIDKIMAILFSAF